MPRPADTKNSISTVRWKLFFVGECSMSMSDACEIFSDRVDLIELAAVGEVYLLGLLPAAEDVVDGEAGHLGKLLRIFARDRFQAGSVEFFGGDLLALGGIQIVEIGLRGGAGAMFIDVLVDQGHRRFGKNGDRRHQ